MTLTLRFIGDHIKHALNGPLSLQGNGAFVANQAGRYWASMHPWRCMERIGRLSLRASISLTGATYTESSTSITKVGAFANYTFVNGDTIEITGGTGANLDIYQVATKQSSDVIGLKTSIGAAANLQTDIAGEMSNAGIALPDNFRQMIDSGGLYMGSLDEVMERRAGQLGSIGFASIGALVWTEPAALIGGPPIPRIEVYPSSGTNTTNAFRIRYRADWKDLTDDGSRAIIPSSFGMEMLYLQIARAIARGYEEDDKASLQLRLAEIHDGPDFKVAREADAMIQPNLGTMRGGAASRHYLSTVSGVFTVQPPS